MATSIRKSRRGFTLVELLIAMVLLSIIGAVMTRLLINMQRSSRAQSQKVMLQSNLRAGMALLPSELRELSAQDLLVTQADRIEYRAMRTTSVACAITLTQVVLRRSLTFGYRPIETNGRDRLFVFLDARKTTGNDDTWRELRVTANIPGGCPDGDPADVLTVTHVDGVTPAFTVAGLLDSVYAGAPVRSFEQMEMRLFESAGRWWLGARSVSGGAAIEPVLGPLAADGLLFTYRDRNGAETATVANMRTIDIALRGQTDGRIWNGNNTMAIDEDALTTRIRLRNAPTF